MTKLNPEFILSTKRGLIYLYNSNQYQNLMSVLCSYYCQYYINESSRHKDYYDVIKPFSQTGTNHNEKLIKHYFKDM